MSRRTAGVIFIFMAIHVYCIKLLVAALYSISSTPATSWGSDVFKEWMSYIGPIPNIISVACLIAGAYYLISEYEKEKEE